MSEGETPAEAIENGRDAVLSYLRSCEHRGDPIPASGAMTRYSGQFRQRIPKSMHARLTARARQEGVSLITLVMAMIAEGLGKRAG